MKKRLLLPLLCFVVLTAAHAQHDTDFVKNIVFEGAGVRGIAYCGAIGELEARSMMKHIEKVGGTSAGAIMALTLALGYSSREISDIIAATNFKRFNDGRFLFAGGINRVSKYFGWYRGEQFERWLETIIAAKTGNADIRFAELSERGFRDLYITGTNLTRQELVIFSKYTYPDMKVKDAVRISMSIPLYFEAVFLDSSGHIVKHPRKKEALDVLVDGGFTGNFPIRIFDSANLPNPATLGFRIDRAEQIRNDQATRSLASLPVTNLRQYLGAFYQMIIENLNRQQLSEQDWQRTVSIDDGNISPRIRKLSKEEKDRLIENGKRALQDYLKKQHG